MSSFKRKRVGSVRAAEKGLKRGRYVLAAQPGRAPRASTPGELKFHDVDVDDAVVAAAGAIQNTGSVNLIAQGVTEVTRIGRKCTIKSINWRYSLSLPVVPTAGAPTADHVRVIFYQDKQANKATAAVLDILETADFESFRNLSNVGRFNILMDKMHTLNYHAGAGDGAANDFAEVKEWGTMYKKCAIPIEFNAGAGALTEITSNNLGVLLITEEGVAGFESKLRLRFSDN